MFLEIFLLLLLLMKLEIEKSGETPRRPKSQAVGTCGISNPQAVRPRDDESRKGMLTKTRNADQDREC